MSKPVIHELKTWPEYFSQVNRGWKLFELRKDDRPWSVGQFIKLREWDPAIQDYSGREVTREINYILRDFKGLEKGYCILGL